MCRGAAFGKSARLIQAGESAGPMFALTADGLRASGVEIYGPLS